MRVTVRRTEDRGPTETASVSASLGARRAGTGAGLRRRPTASCDRGADGRNFYRAPQPGAPPFVQEGDTRRAGAEPLCILEAMKLMNEVKADQEATVRSIAVENGEAVEYGQPLFELEPALGRPLDAL